MTKHVHAEAMAQYAEDLREDIYAWKDWEYRTEGSNRYYPLMEHPKWLSHNQYRRSFSNVDEYAKCIKDYIEVLKSFSVDSLSTETPQDLWEVSDENGSWKPLLSPPVPGIGIKYRRRCPIKTTHINLNGAAIIHGLVDPEKAPRASFIHYLKVDRGQEIRISEVLHDTALNIRLAIANAYNSRFLCFWHKEDAIEAKKKLDAINVPNPLRVL